MIFGIKYNFMRKDYKIGDKFEPLQGVKFYHIRDKIWKNNGSFTIDITVSDFYSIDGIKCIEVFDKLYKFAIPIEELNRVGSLENNQYFNIWN